MTINTATQNQEHPQEASNLSDKELNFRKQEAVYKKMLEEERAARLKAEMEAERISKERLRKVETEEEFDDSSDEPYVDNKRLEKKLAKFGQKTKQETESIIQQEVQKALSEERKNNWLKNNSDFYEVMQHAQTFADRDPELAETILSMPDTFERQKLVYKNIKALGLHKKEEPKSSIQETINKNQRSPYYQPSGTGAPPYGVVAGGKDYSTTEAKNAYQKMKELQSKLRI